MLSIAKTAEVPDQHQILTRNLTTSAATDYLSSSSPLSLSVDQTANRLGTSVAGSSDGCPGRTADGANEGSNSVSNFVEGVKKKLHLPGGKVLT